MRPRLRSASVHSFFVCGLILSLLAGFAGLAPTAAAQTSPVNFGPVNLGSSETLSPSYNIPAGTVIGSVQVVTQGLPNLDYSPEANDTSTTVCTPGSGNSGTSCTVDVTFAPRAPGVRNGAVVIKDGNGNLIAETFLTGVGLAPQLAFGSGIQYPVYDPSFEVVDVAVDAGGDLFFCGFFIPDGPGDAGTVGLAAELYPVGPPGPGMYGPPYTVTGHNDGLKEPLAGALDGAGNYFVVDVTLNEAVEYPAGGGGQIVLPVSGLQSPGGVAVDGAGNVYIADTGNNRVVEVPAGGGTPMTLPLPGLVSPRSLKFDAAGNLYITIPNTSQVVKYPAGGGSQALLPVSGLNTPVGLAIDAAGDLFIGNAGTQSVIEVPGGGGPQITLTGVNVNDPVGLAVDGANNLFIAGGPNPFLYELPRSQPPAFTFASTQLGKKSSPQSFTVQNTGNAPLNATEPGLTVTPGFEVVPGSGTPVDCTPEFSLAPGASCNISIAFTPKSGGATNGFALISDNSLNGTPTYQTISLSGTGVADLTASCPSSAAPVGIGYSSSLTASGGFPPYAFSITNGSLPPGLRLDPASGAITGVPSSLGSSAFTATVADSESDVKQLSCTLAVESPQTITFNPIAIQTATTTLPLSASASSGLAVTYASTTPRICTVSGTTANLLDIGTCSITASQAGNSTYSPATPISQSFDVNDAVQTITFAPISAQTALTVVPLSATTSAGLPVSFTSNTANVCAISGKTNAKLLASGTCTVTASQAGNNSYAPAIAVAQSFPVDPAAQTITFGLLSSQTAGIRLALVAAASSGLSVSFSSTTPAVCTVSGRTATLRTQGVCSITASQAGNSRYGPATPVAQSFAVNLASQTITFNAIPDQASGTKLTMTAVASSRLAVTYTAAPGSVCTVTGKTARFVAAGSCSITASQTGNTVYSAAAPVQQTVMIE